MVEETPDMDNQHEDIEDDQSRSPDSLCFSFQWTHPWMHRPFSSLFRSLRNGCGCVGQLYPTNPTDFSTIASEKIFWLPKKKNRRTGLQAAPT